MSSADSRLLPSPPLFQVVISHEGTTVVITPHGDIDSSTSPTLALALSSLLAEDRPSIVLNLADVELLDPDRAWVIGEASRLFRQRDGRLAVAEANAGVREAFQSADLSWLLDERPDPVVSSLADDAPEGSD